MNKTGVALTALVGGVLIGAAATMLLTSESGTELRKKIKNLVDDEVDKVRDKVDEFCDKLEKKEKHHHAHIAEK